MQAACALFGSLAWKWMAGFSSLTCSLPVVAQTGARDELETTDHSYSHSSLELFLRPETDCTGRLPRVSDYKEQEL